MAMILHNRTSSSSSSGTSTSTNSSANDSERFLTDAPRLTASPTFSVICKYWGIGPHHYDDVEQLLGEEEQLDEGGTWPEQVPMLLQQHQPEDEDGNSLAHDIFAHQEWAEADTARLLELLEESGTIPNTISNADPPGPANDNTGPRTTASALLKGAAVEIRQRGCKLITTIAEERTPKLQAAAAVPPPPAATPPALPPEEESHQEQGAICTATDQAGSVDSNDDGTESHSSCSSSSSSITGTF